MKGGVVGEMADGGGVRRRLCGVFGCPVSGCLTFRCGDSGSCCCAGSKGAVRGLSKFTSLFSSTNACLKVSLSAQMVRCRCGGGGCHLRF